MNQIQTTNPDSTENLLSILAKAEQIRKNRIENVTNVLVVLPARALAFDRDALQEKINATYSTANVYFVSTLGHPVGRVMPTDLDLVIDFTGPGHRHKWFFARKLRSKARFLVGRNAGFFRAYIYDRIFNEFKEPNIPNDTLEREKYVQRQVLELAGVPISQRGQVNQDLSKKIAADLPRLKKRI